jgi:hypothetical protein
MARLTKQDRQNLDILPVRITLPAFTADNGDSITVESGGFSLRLPRPISVEQKLKSWRVDYAKFRVLILPAHSSAELDLLAQQLHFRDAFDEISAPLQARFSDLDAQPDARSVRNLALLLASKIDKYPCQEQFDCDDLRGFIRASGKMPDYAFVQLFSRKENACVGVHFYGKPGFTMDDVHAFISGTVVIASSDHSAATTSATTKMGL